MPPLCLVGWVTNPATSSFRPARVLRHIRTRAKGNAILRRIMAILVRDPELIKITKLVLCIRVIHHCSTP